MDISLALGGGGAKGNAHIGVIHRLEKEGFRIRALAGTSFGGIVAVIFASGYSSAEVEDLFASVNQSRLYGRESGDGPALLGLSGVRKWLDEVIGEKTFDDLKIPCAVTAVDLKSGQEVIISEGRLKDAALSTIALPGIFPPHHLHEWTLVDGGVLDPVPVSVARGLAPDLPVVAVVLSLPVGVPARTWTMPVPSIVPRSIAERITRMNFAQTLEIFMRGIEIGNRALAEYRLEVDHPEVIIRPDVSQIELLDRVDVHRVARIGEEAVQAVLPELKRVVAWPTRLSRILFGARK